MAISISAFRGTRPRLSPRLLEDSEATVALNTKLTSGVLRGMKVPQHVHTAEVPEALSVKRIKEPDDSEFAWFYGSRLETEILKSPLQNDAFNRWYVFEPDAGPFVTTFEDVQNRRSLAPLALVGPSRAPQLGLDENTPGDDTLLDSRVYVYTYVTEWGEETTPSPPASISVPLEAGVVVQGFYGGGQKPQGRSFKYVRIYRTVSGQSSVRLHFVKDLEFGGVSYTDDNPSSIVVFNSTLGRWNEPPPPDLVGARAHPSGALVAFKGREVLFSEPYLPHAWPAEYRVTVPDKITAIEVVGDNVMVVTEGAPSIVFGSEPSNIGLLNFPMALPCPNYNSVVGAPEGAYYISQDGLVLLGPNGPQVVTLPVASREEWVRDYYGTDYMAAQSEAAYLAINPAGRGFQIDRASGQVAIQTFTGVPLGTSFCKDRYTGEVLFGKDGVIYRWDPEDGDEGDYVWRSKEFYLPRPGNFHSVQIELNTRVQEYVPGGEMENTFHYTDQVDKRSQVVFTAWADGVEVVSMPVGNREMVGLPRGFEATIWQFQIAGQVRVHSIAIAQSGVGQRNV